MRFGWSWRTSLGASVCLSVILLAAVFVLLLKLPSYNPYTFREDFNGPLDPNIWETVGSGTLTAGRDGVTLQSNTEQPYALRRYLWAQPKWHPPDEQWVRGVVELRFRFNDYSSGASAYVIVETDSIRLGLLRTSVVVQDKLIKTRNSTVPGFENGRWYSLEIRYSKDEIEIRLDGLVIWNSEIVLGFTMSWIAIGNLQQNAFDNPVGGSLTVAQIGYQCKPDVP